MLATSPPYPVLITEDSFYMFSHISVAGCGRPTVPHGVDVEVSGSRAVAVCNLTGEKTHLICKGVQWVGHVNPCVAQTTSE